MKGVRSCRILSVSSVTPWTAAGDDLHAGNAGMDVVDVFERDEADLVARRAGDVLEHGAGAGKRLRVPARRRCVAN